MSVDDFVLPTLVATADEVFDVPVTAVRESALGTFRKCRNVRFESGMRTKADVPHLWLRARVEAIAVPPLPQSKREMFLISPTGKSVFSVKPQISSCPHGANQWHFSARLTRQEGRLAIVTKRAVGCGGRGGAIDERH